VIAVDTNILVYAHRGDSVFHASAKRRLRELAEGGVAWAIPWCCIHEFFGIATHPRIYSPPTPSSKALLQIDAWLQSPSLVLLAENDVYWPAARRTLAASRVTGPRVHDARIASLCAAHGVTELWSADRDFSRFTELRVSNPLTG
jgi:toxin-antitoxin system PIN domain toxin